MIFWAIRKWKARQARKHHDKVVKNYFTFAASLGDAISYMHMGDVRFDLDGKTFNPRDPETYHALHEHEVAYAELGYRVICLDAWVDYAGWGVNIDALRLQKRDANESPNFTKSEEKRELPEKSPLLDIVMQTGKACEQVTDEDGNTTIRVIEDE